MTQSALLGPLQSCFQPRFHPLESITCLATDRTCTFVMPFSGFCDCPPQGKKLKFFEGKF